jgi:division protein CdvB (Snf7/Vps24/ESCRT-III family)
MSIDYHKVWQVMNDLEELTPKLCTIRELISYAAESAQIDQIKTEHMAYASVDLIDQYLEEWDVRFKKAWNNTVLELKDQVIQEMREKNHAFSVEPTY